MRHLSRTLAGLSLLVISSACTLTPTSTTPHLAQTAYHRDIPRSILVLPPLNETTEMNASARYLSTISAVLGERGYYVPPIAMVNQMLRDNGLTLPGQMHQAPLSRLTSVFGVDAVLYVTIQHWGASLGAHQVTFDYRLVETRGGTEIWRRSATGRRPINSESNANINDEKGWALIAKILIHLIIDSAVAEVIDIPLDLVRETNARAINSSEDQLLLGPYHPGFHAQQLQLSLPDLPPQD